MSTKRETILSAITTKLQTIPGLTVQRSRPLPFGRQKLPAAGVEPVQDIADNSTIHYNDWSLVIQVMLLVKGDVPDQVADPFLQAIYEKLMEDQALGGLTMDIQPISFENDIIEGDGANGVAILRFRISYRTSSKILA